MEIEDNKVSKFHTVIQKCIVRVNLLIDYEEKALFKKKKKLGQPLGFGRLGSLNEYYFRVWAANSRGHLHSTGTRSPEKSGMIFRTIEVRKDRGGQEQEAYEIKQG